MEFLKERTATQSRDILLKFYAFGLSQSIQTAKIKQVILDYFVFPI